MCNLLRYKTKMQLPEFADEINDIRITPAFNFRVAPSEPAPVLFRRESALRIGMMTFGFAAARGRQMMARGETVHQKPTFRDAFKSRRCLVLVHGFYDSEDLGRSLPKQPWHIHLRDDGLMTFAALWETGTDSGSFTIVSAPANRVVGRVIDRMPVILSPGQRRLWMNLDTPPDSLLPLLRPFPDELMEAYPVTPKVNQKGFNGPQCIVPIIPAQGSLDLL